MGRTKLPAAKAVVGRHEVGDEDDLGALHDQRAADLRVAEGLVADRDAGRLRP